MHLHHSFNFNSFVFLNYSALFATALKNNMAALYFDSKTQLMSINASFAPNFLQVYPHEYDLVLRPDVNTKRHTQWYVQEIDSQTYKHIEKRVHTGAKSHSAHLCFAWTAQASYGVSGCWLKMCHLDLSLRSLKSSLPLIDKYSAAYACMTRLE